MDIHEPCMSYTPLGQKGINGVKTPCMDSKLSNSLDLEHQTILGSQGSIKVKTLLNPSTQNTKETNGKPLNLGLEEANQQDLKIGTYKVPEGDPKGKE